MIDVIDSQTQAYATRFDKLVQESDTDSARSKSYTGRLLGEILLGPSGEISSKLPPLGVFTLRLQKLEFNFGNQNKRHDACSIKRKNTE